MFPRLKRKSSFKDLSVLLSRQSIRLPNPCGVNTFLCNSSDLFLKLKIKGRNSPGLLELKKYLLILVITFFVTYHACLIPQF